MIIDSGIVTGSLQVSGSFSVQGNTELNGGLNVLGGITGSISGSSATAVSASYAATASYILSAGVEGPYGPDSITNAVYAASASFATSAPAYVPTASYNAASASVSTRVTNLESWSSSLDAIYATDAQLNASASALQAGVTASIAAFATTGSNIFTGTNRFDIVSASYIQALSASIEYLSVIYQTSSVVYSSGSNQFGDSPADTQTLYGTIDIKNGPVLVTGSIGVSNTATATSGSFGHLYADFTKSKFVYASGSSQLGNNPSDYQAFFGTIDIINGPVLVTGSLNVANRISAGELTVLYGITGSLNGTASYADAAITASLALLALSANTASFVQQAQNAFTASYVLNAQTASYVETAQFAITASYVNLAQTASYVQFAQNAFTASYVNLAQSASYVANAVSASRAISAANADTASFVLNAVSSSYSIYTVSASHAIQADLATTASYILSAVSASYAVNTTNAATASSADNFTVRGFMGVGGPTDAFHQLYVTTSISDGTLGLDSSGEVNALYFLKGGVRGFEISTAVSSSHVIQLLPYTSSGFFQIGNPSNASSDMIFLSEPTGGRVILGPGIASGSTSLSGSQQTDKVQFTGNTFVSGALTVLGNQNSQGTITSTGFIGNLTGTATTAISAPYYVTTASYNADSSSVSTRVTNLESFSSSLDSLFVNNAELNAATGSLQAGVTASINLATASLQAGVSASIAGFATTGSNQFKASQFVTGSIISTANIQANKFVSTDGVVNESTTGQLMYATNGGYMYLYTGPNGLFINNQANNANNVTISDAGVVQTRGALTVGAPGNNQNIIFGGSDAKLDWAGTGAQIFYSAGALQFSSVNGSNNMVLQNGGGALFNSGITGSLQATNGVISSSVQLAGAGFATTASNTFTGAQYISNTTNATNFTSTAALYTDGGLRVTKDSYVSGGLWVAGDLTVYGTSSVNYVTTSVFVGLEYINLNTDLPALRFAGINVGDSGSAAGISSSFWYDSEKDNWLYVHAHQGTDETSSLAINGPITYNNLGNEQGLLANYITKGQLVDANNNHHITSSQIYDDGTTVAIAGNLQVTGSLRAGNLTGSLNGSNLVAGSVGNDRLTNSAITIAGTSTSLGGSITAATILSGTGVFSGSAQIPNTSITNAQLANSAVTVTAGTGLSGGGSVSLGGSVTLTNAGVTSAVAGTGVSVSGATGAVTISIGQAVNTNSNVTFGNVTSTNQFVTVSSGTAALNLSGSATQGGSTFFDFIRATNTAGGSTNINKSIRINSTGAMEWVNSAYSTVILTLTDAGALTAAADVTAFSDARLKENVNTITGALEKVGRLRGVTYNRIDLEDKSEKLGFIAQEVLEVIPQVVLGSEEETYSVAYGNITALHNEAIKEQQTQIEELKAEILELKGIINTLINK